MRPAFRPVNNPLLFSIFFSTLAFGGAFWFSLQRDRDQAAELGQLAQSHLSYALQLRDDMAVIDWARSLEKSNHISAFQATVQSKQVAQGGNENFIPAQTRPGLHFRFPSNWIFRSDWTVEGSDSNRLLLVYHPSPGPLAIGFAVSIGCFLALYATARLSTRPRSQSSSQPMEPALSSPTRAQPLPIPQAEVDGKKFLFLDRNYVIRKISPEAAQLLGREPSELIQGHLFDLSPDPALMRAIEKGEETHFPKAFSSYPGLSVSLKPDSNGTLLFLESLSGSEVLKKL
jgi:hypothetical protein